MTVRETSFELIETGRRLFGEAARPGADNVFEWQGDRYWVDQVRHLAMLELAAEELVEGEARTLPRSEETEEELKVLVGQGIGLQVGELLDFFAAAAAGTEGRGGSLAGMHLLNLACGQPLVNPALGPLFWLVLSDELKLPLHRPVNMWDVVADLIYDMTRYPKSLADADTVRRAQIEYADEHLGFAVDEAEAAAMSDDEWAARCQQQLDGELEQLDRRVFAEVAARARRLERQ